MDSRKCCRCKNDLGLGSVVIVEAKGDRISLAHFFCATAAEVKGLYGPSPSPVNLPMGEPQEK
jgi:hypothetical protein